MIQGDEKSRVENMDYSRLESWIKASRFLETTELFMQIVLQWLGRLDCELIDEDERLLAGGLTNPTREQTIALNNNLPQSYLWVLGAYELIRTIDQRHREGTIKCSDVSAKELSAVKNKYERVRVPLAKMEPSYKHPTDSHIAYPIVDVKRGIGWQLNKDVVVTRRELSDGLLEILSRLAKEYETK